jgi:tRNA dimethylallyltransferase
MMKRRFLQSFEPWLQTLNQKSKPRVLSVLGPTGSGKTGFVVQLLRKHPHLLSQNPLLVSIDAVSVYRELDIGSAKVSGPDRSDFDWIGLDILDVSESITVRRFLDSVEIPIAQAIEEGRPVILCGGSGFYERALVEGQAPGAESDPLYQETLKAIDNSILAQRLYRFDPRWKDKVHANDRYRLTRFLDLVERQGFSYDDLFHSKIRHPRLRSLWTETDTLLLGLERPREEYLQILSTRIDSMFREGFEAEARALYNKWGPQAPGLASMGYREMNDFFEGRFNLEQTKARILQSHLDYVKKQKTWFRGLSTASKSAL